MRSTERDLRLLPADEEEFSRLLREAFPEIRFLRYEYWRRRIDGGQDQKLAPPNLKLHYYDSLAVPGEMMLRAWREPEKWKPVWTDEPNRNGVYGIVNEPRHQFVYQSCCGVRTSEHGGWLYRNPTIREGRFFAYWNKEDKEAQSFVNKVWRITGKLTSNRLILVDEDTKKPISGPHRPYIWVGHHARRWCLADPMRTIQFRWRPVEGDDHRTK